MEELLRQAFQLGQQWVQDIEYNTEKEPTNFNDWFNSDEVQKQVKLLRQPDVIKSVCGKCGNNNVKSENGKQVYCSWCDTDW